MAEHSIARYMTAGAYVAAPGESLEQARAKMRDNEIRHLPVVDESGVVGVLSSRDLVFIDRLPGVSADLSVRDAMTADPYVVDASTPVSAVAREMARRKIGSAVIVKDGEVAGIFTAVDALDLLAEVFETDWAS